MACPPEPSCGPVSSIRDESCSRRPAPGHHLSLIPHRAQTVVMFGGWRTIGRVDCRASSQRHGEQSCSGAETDSGKLKHLIAELRLALDSEREANRQLRQWTAISIVAAVLGNTGRGDLIVPVIVTIVALHFVPLARVLHDSVSLLGLPSDDSMGHAVLPDSIIICGYPPIRHSRWHGPDSLGDQRVRLVANSAVSERIRGMTRALTTPSFLSRTLGMAFGFGRKRLSLRNR